MLVENCMIFSLLIDFEYFGITYNMSDLLNPQP